MADPAPLTLALDTSVQTSALEDGDEALAARVLQRAVELERGRLPAGTHAVYISLVLTDDAAIAALNARFRGIDAPTDVLSFPAHEDLPAGDAPPNGVPLPLGDIVVSLPRAATQARDYGHSREREVGFLLVHGLLHLLGYDHDEPDAAADMEERQEAVLRSVGLRRDE